MASMAAESSRQAAAAVVPKQDDSHRYKILVCGWRKAGKTSCIKTVFQDVPIKDVPYFGTTQKIEKINYDSIIPLQLWDTPHNFELDHLDVPLHTFQSMVYVMDMQQDDSYHEAILRCVHMFLRAYLANRHIKLSVFIHKSEVLSEDYRGENYGEIQRDTYDTLADYDFRPFHAQAPDVNFASAEEHKMFYEAMYNEIKFVMTSVHDVSLKDAWSRVVQGILEPLPNLEKLLINFSVTSAMENSFLFDMRSGVILASDNRQRNDDTISQLTEYVARFIQFRDLYKGLKIGSSEANGNGEAGITEEGEELTWWDAEDPEEPWAFQATRLLPKTTLALWQLTPHLVVVALAQTVSWQSARGQIEYNLTHLRQGVRRIIQALEA